MTATGSWANGKPLDTAAQMAAPPYANPNEHRAPMKSPSECGHRPGVPAGWKLGDTEALRDDRQLGRHVDLLTNKAFSWKLPGGSGYGLLILAQLGAQDTANFRRQPGQMQRGVGRRSTQGAHLVYILERTSAFFVS